MNDLHTALVLLGMVVTGITVFLQLKLKDLVHSEMQNVVSKMEEKFATASKERKDVVERLEHMERGYSQHHLMLEAIMKRQTEQDRIISELRRGR